MEFYERLGEGVVEGERVAVSPRHSEIIRLKFLGMKHVDIAAAMNLSEATVGHLLKSPLAEAELERLKTRAEESVTNVPLRVKLLQDLNDSTADSLRINREILRDKTVNPAIRSRVGMHFMDRVLFNKGSQEDQEGSYRDVLRRLDTIQRQIEDVRKVEIHTDNVEVVNVGSNGDGPENREAPQDTERPLGVLSTT